MLVSMAYQGLLDMMWTVSFLASCPVVCSKSAHSTVTSVYLDLSQSMAMRCDVHKTVLSGAIHSMETSTMHDIDAGLLCYRTQHILHCKTQVGLTTKEGNLYLIYIRCQEWPPA